MRHQFSEIWLVDDDSDDLMFHSEALKRVGNDLVVRTFSNGQSALEALRQQPRATSVIIVADGHMPKLGGIDLAKIIYQECLAARHKVVILTGSISKAEQELAKSLHIEVHLKPLDPSNLSEVFENILRNTVQ